MKTCHISPTARSLGLYLAGIALVCATQLGFAADTSIGNVPLFTSSSINVKPNLMFILDDSGSMSSNYIPDEANFSTTKYGKLASQCNGVAYNPTVTYALPVDSAGNSASPGSTSILTPDPNVQLTNKDTLASPSSLSLSAAVGSTLTVTIGGLGSNNAARYNPGDTVTLFSTGNTTSYIVATVSTWSITNNRTNNTGTLVVTVNSTTGTGTLSSGLRVAPGSPTVTAFYYTYTGSNKPLAYTYTSSGVITTTSFYQECNSVVGATPGSAVFNRVNVTASAAEAQNYANWYAYYRTRIQMARSSIGLVFQSLDSRYRVGYSTISEDTVTEGTNFVNIRDFDATQKASFFAALNNASPGSYTPLRGALSKAGRYYANKYPGQTYDPVQYACQKNFTILSTDGYWNTNDETSTYGPYGLDGNNVGQTDSYPAARPKYDGGTSTATNRTTWNTVRTVVTQTATTTTSYANAVITTTGTYGTGSGSITTTYSGAVANTGLSAAGGTCKTSCTVTVTAPNHGFSTGNTVTIMGSNGDAAFNGSFIITKVDANTFTYLGTGFSKSSPSSPSTKGSSLLKGSCAAGSGSVTANKSQIDTYPLTLLSTTTADITQTTSYTQNRAVTTTPYTETQTVVNGAITTDTTSAGTASVVNTALASPANTVSTQAGQVTSGPTSSAGTSYVSAAVALSSTAMCVSNATPAGPTPTSTLVTTKPTYATTSPATSISSSTAPAVKSTISDSGEVKDNASVSTTSTSTTSGGSSNSLADVAYYYYNNDLRDDALWSNCTGALGTSVCGTSDKFLKQNMITLTLGLGVSGLLAYDKNYIAQKSPGSGDFYALKNGDKNWPVPGNGKSAENIDDLWHAAINATDFGTAAIPVTNPSTQYFSAGNPSILVESLTNALANVKAVVGSSSAAATSTLQPVTGDNDVFVAKFTSVKWIGDVQRFSIDPALGTVSTSYSWSAAAQLDARDLSVSPRNVYYAKGGQSALQSFNYSNLTSDGLNSNFDGFCNKAGSGGNTAPSQCGLIAGASLTAANSGSNLVAYLLGANDANYRARDSRLGDVINGAPLFVGPPKFKYIENNYAAFAASTRQAKCAAGTAAGSATTQGTIYVGANDGMLHAFDRCDGSEKWAYVPKMVMPAMYKIADNAYGNNHQYFVDGAPVTGDIFVNGAWKTILVGGLNAGGRGYYALDITDPASPKALWEFSNNNNANLGLSFGNPIITKRATDGRWVVVFASGYNNNTANSAAATGDGNGHLFMLDANTGAAVLNIPTLSGTSNVGSTSSPSGFAKINAWVETETDNTALRYYGGDLLGNVWRFDTENLVAPNQKALLLGRVTDGTNAQPITIQPELAQVSYQGANYAVVYVGTGQYLGQGDLGTTGKQSIYAFKDALGSTSLGDLRNGNTLVAQTLTTTGAVRTATTNAVDWGTKNGWYVDLPTSGERVNISMVLAFNVLSVASTVPSASACESGGTSWLYKLDIASGSAISNAADNAAGLLLQEGTLIVGQTVVQLTDGSATTISTLSTGNLRSDSEPPPPSGDVLRRTSWRELAN